MKNLDIVVSNLRALESASRLSETQFAARCKLHQRTYNRIVNKETIPKIDILELIAEANDLELWQLFIKDLDVTNPPILERDSKKQKEFYEKIKTLAKELDQQ